MIDSDRLAVYLAISLYFLRRLLRKVYGVRPAVPGEARDILDYDYIVYNPDDAGIVYVVGRYDSSLYDELSNVPSPWGRHLYVFDPDDIRELVAEGREVKSVFYLHPGEAAGEGARAIRRAAARYDMFKSSLSLEGKL